MTPCPGVYRSLHGVYAALCSIKCARWHPDSKGLSPQALRGLDGVWRCADQIVPKAL